MPMSTRMAAGAPGGRAGGGVARLGGSRRAEGRLAVGTTGLEACKEGGWSGAGAPGCVCGLGAQRASRPAGERRLAPGRRLRSAAAAPPYRCGFRRFTHSRWWVRVAWCGGGDKKNGLGRLDTSMIKGFVSLKSRAMNVRRCGAPGSSPLQSRAAVQPGTTALEVRPTRGRHERGRLITPPCCASPPPPTPCAPFPTCASGPPLPPLARRGRRPGCDRQDMCVVKAYEFDSRNGGPDEYE
jgi:hypothetical protein